MYGNFRTTKKRDLRKTRFFALAHVIDQSIGSAQGKKKRDKTKGTEIHINTEEAPDFLFRKNPLT